MDIIKKGDYSWNMKVTCTGYKCSDYPCFSELLISQEDIVFLLNEQILCYGFICPICHQFTEIDANLLPYSVKNTKITQIAEKNSPEYEKLTEYSISQLSNIQEKLCETVIATDFRKNLETEKQNN